MITKPEALILRAVSALETATRRTIADFTSMSLVSVSQALKSLQKSGVLVHDARSREGGGRPTFYYAFNRDTAAFIGVAVGRWRFRVAVMGADETILSEETHGLSLSEEASNHASQIVEQVSSVVRDVVNRNEIPVFGVGVTLPGVTDSRHGVWVEGMEVNGVSRTNIRDSLSTAIGLPVWIEDPARASAFLELRRNAAPNCPSFMLMYLGSGVGAGIIIDGKPYSGCNGLAAEIGHIVVDSTGSRCTCGDIGCFETVASSTGILRIVSERLQAGVVSSLTPVWREHNGELSFADLLLALERGDRLAESVMTETATHIAHVCAIAMKFLNPGFIIISGEASAAAKYKEQQIAMEVRNRVMPSLLGDCKVRFADYHEHDESLGAAMIALHAYWEAKADAMCSTNERQLPLGPSVP